MVDFIVIFCMITLFLGQMALLIKQDQTTNSTNY